MKRLAGKPFVMLGVNSDEDPEVMKKAIAREKITWKNWWDKSIEGPIHQQWQIAQRPGIHLIDGKGIIRHRNIDATKVDEAIDEMLKDLTSTSKK